MALLTVRDVMVSDPVVIAPEAGADEAARLMLEHRISSVVVCNGDAIEGILTPNDLMRGMIEGGGDGATVGSVMTPTPSTIDASEPFETAMQVMDDKHIRHLPVTDAGRLCGMISVRDLMRCRTEYLEQLVQRQTADLEQQNHELAERDRHMRYHLDLAGRIQQQLLPTAVPDLAPLSLSVHHEALAHVSGDWYDVVQLTRDRVGILIADACGHGVPAAFISVMARAVFQAADRESGSPAAILRLMNDRLPELIREEHFLSMCYAVVDRRTRDVTYAMAGHPPPLWYRHETSDVEPLPGLGDLMGVIPDPSFDERHIRLGPRDAILFYTDGVIEATDPDRTLFGRQRAASTLLDSCPGSSGALVEALDVRLKEFRGGTGPSDDTTWIVLSVDGA